MLYNEDIICLSSIDWDFIWQGHQEIMSTLAANGNRILFVENTGVRAPTFQDLPRLKKRIYNWFHSVKGIRKEAENLYIYAPLVLPFPYSRVARVINRHLMISALRRWIKSVGLSSPIIWTFLPTGLVLDILDEIDSRAVIYYCIDNFEASSIQAKKIRRTEEALIRRSDIVFVTAKDLYNKCTAHNKNVHLFPYGVSLKVYEKASAGVAKPPHDIAAVKHPIVGYVGGVHKWIDFELIKFLAQENPDKSFVFVGPLQQDVGGLREMKNIYFLGQKRYEELPLYISQFDACIIPYRLTEYTKNVYPTKINEYLFLGKSVISTPIPEVEAFNRRNDNIVSIGNSKEHFSALLNKAVEEKAGNEIIKKRKETAVREGSWDVKIDKMSELIIAKIADKNKERAVKWKDNLLKLYKKSKKRLIPAIGAVLVAYVILFHTPFLWMIGKPLKVSTTLAKADAIIVLAGGVGESGQPGQGYEERVEYSVELYKKGYADKMIFSSGFQYAIKEAEIMKVLAVSLGVPENSIIIENKAINNYENIKFSKAILDANKWKKAILISSPYNMLRVSLACRKIAPDIHYIYAPIPYSLFYENESKVRLKHIRAIFHEYIGIVYYYFKGWI